MQMLDQCKEIMGYDLEGNNREYTRMVAYRFNNMLLKEKEAKKKVQLMFLIWFYLLSSHMRKNGEYL
ncbi:hypothetical protein TSUD_240500 [Trifolium subterraneum]|uniref:Uncharacterized protein n=1 Tax=Trifolium subterraneum TaxID=3900 RepID=A0A2Z6NGK5_TRISU|nr:hypothetical protein TSUD_240500 [Trifolium subterraneum]